MIRKFTKAWLLLFVSFFGFLGVLYGFVKLLMWMFALPHGDIIVGVSVAIAIITFISLVFVTTENTEDGY